MGFFHRKRVKKVGDDYFVYLWPEIVPVAFSLVILPPVILPPVIFPAIVALSIVCATTDVITVDPAVVRIAVPVRMATIANNVILSMLDKISHCYLRRSLSSFSIFLSFFGGYCIKCIFRLLCSVPPQQQ
jgi:hypothetical protein